MTNGQTRVVMLLIVLAFLEVAANPTIKQWFKTAYNAIGQGIQPK